MTSDTRDSNFKNNSLNPYHKMVISIGCQFFFPFLTNTNKVSKFELHLWLYHKI